jgi:hypothetical protein
MVDGKGIIGGNLKSLGGRGAPSSEAPVSFDSRESRRSKVQFPIAKFEFLVESRVDFTGLPNTERPATLTDGNTPNDRSHSDETIRQWAS